jgi:Calx-beta domain-containing protein
VTTPRPEPTPAPRREAAATPQRETPVTPRREPPVAEQTRPAAPPPAVAQRVPEPVREVPVQAPPIQATPVAAGPTSFMFQQGVVTVREGDVAARITIRRSGDLSGSASVSWWTAQGTARADADYADLGARIERFAPGEASRTIYVPLTNDAVREEPKNFRVLLGRGEGGEAASETRVDLIDDD